MKANIDKNGIMTLIPENDIEEFAAIRWYQQQHVPTDLYYHEDNTPAYPYSKIAYPKREDNDKKW